MTNLNIQDPNDGVSNLCGDLRIEVVVGCLTDQQDLHMIMSLAATEGLAEEAAGDPADHERFAVAGASNRPMRAFLSADARLHNSWLIYLHGREDERTRGKEMIASCYRDALLLADRAHAPSIGLPTLSPGAFGNSCWATAMLALSVIREVGPHLRHLALVRFIASNETEFRFYRRALDQALGQSCQERVLH